MMILMKRCLTLCLALSLLLSLLVPVRAEGTQTKRTLTAEDLTLTCVKVYDDNDVAQPEIRIANLGEDQVFVQYEQARYDNPYVGTQKTVAVTGLTLTGEDAGNYTLGDLTQLTGNVGQITPQTLSVSDAELAEGGLDLDLRTLVQGAQKNSVIFSIENAAQSEISEGILKSGNKPETLTILAHTDGMDINGDGTLEYNQGDVIFTVTIVPQQTQPPVNIEVDTPATPVQDDQPDISLTGGTQVTYGQTLQLGITGGAGQGAVTYTVLDNDKSGDATIDANGLLTPVKAGTVWVAAKKAGDSQYKSAKAEPLMVTILPAKLTVTVLDQTAVVGDPLPILGEESYTVSGLVGQDQMQALPTLSYAYPPDMSKPGTVEIQASGGLVPDEVNYDPEITYVSGALTIQEAPLYAIALSCSEGGILTADQETAAPESKVILTAQAQEGYVLSSLTVSWEQASSILLIETGPDRWEFSMPEGDVTVTAVFTPEELPQMNFSDVTEADWFYDSVAYVFQNGLMTGTSETTFSPNLTTNRAMLVTILYRLEGSPEAPSWSPFGDVPAGEYYAAPVAWAAWHGIVTGKTTTSFAPQDPVTREQMAAILYRYAGYKGYDRSRQGNLSQFADQDQIQDYARAALSWANGEGLITGKGAGILDPQGPATRAQVAAILQRFCEKFAL